VELKVELVNQGVCRRILHECLQNSVLCNVNTERIQSATWPAAPTSYQQKARTVVYKLAAAIRLLCSHHFRDLQFNVSPRVHNLAGSTCHS
jgi:hypothetical protein